MPDTRDAEIVAASLQEYTDRVRQTEDGGGEFLDNRVQVIDGDAVNRTTFTLLPIGHLPNTAPTFVKLADLPAGKQASWTGVVVVGGRNTAVHLYREAIGGEA